MESTRPTCRFCRCRGCGTRRGGHPVLRTSQILYLIGALLLFAQAVIYLRTTLIGKFACWRRVLTELQLDGDESLLDVGCGRGMVLMIAACCCPPAVWSEGHWSSHDQSGNSVAAAESNAAANSVADRVRFETADMTDMPFEDESFDVVTASVSIHNIKDPAMRARAIAEIYRVTRPGGRIRLVELAHADEYRENLASLGAVDPAVPGLGLDGMWGNPFYASKLVSASKPEAAS
jgi:SAM-dependent methyltransferase